MSELIFIQLTRLELEQVVTKAVETALMQHKQADLTEILTISETAKFLSVSLPTLYQKTAKSEIPHFKVGRKLYFKKSDLLNWIESKPRFTDSEINQMSNSFKSNINESNKGQFEGKRTFKRS